MYAQNLLTLFGFALPLRILLSHFRFCSPTSDSALPLQILLSRFRFCSPTSDFALPLQILLSHFGFCSPTSDFALPLRILLSHFRFCSPTSDFALPLSVSCQSPNISLVFFNISSSFKRNLNSTRRDDAASYPPASSVRK